MPRRSSGSGFGGGGGGWDPSWPRYPASKPRPVEGGLATSKKRGAMAESWWSQRLVDVLESFGLGGRMERGRRYARAGQIVRFEVAPGLLDADVQGSRGAPYRVAVRSPLPSEAQWAAVDEVVGARVGFVARLLAGEVPPELEDAFAEGGVALFPARWSDLSASCSCPDGANPCKHIAAVLYLFADRLDADPWLLLAWRGRTRDEVLAPLPAIIGEPAVDGADGDGGAASTLPPWWPLEPGTATLDHDADPLTLLSVDPPERPATVLDRLAALDLDVRGAAVADLLADAYPTITTPGETMYPRNG